MAAYLAIEAGWLTHPKVIGLSPHARMMWVAAGLHAVAHETDGIIQKNMIPVLSYQIEITPKRGASLATSLVEAGLWEDKGNHYEIHDFLDYNPSRADREQMRAKWRRAKALYNDKQLIAAVRERDGNECRYCGRTVDWRDRRGPGGGTYDHVDPALGNDYDNVVVACRSCNSKKGNRTPHAAGLTFYRPSDGPAGFLPEPTDSRREVSEALPYLALPDRKAFGSDPTCRKPTDEPALPEPVGVTETGLAELARIKADLAQRCKPVTSDNGQGVAS